MNKIVFYGHDQKTAGGVQNIIVNISIELANRNIGLVVFCHSDSYVFNNLNNISSFIEIIKTDFTPVMKWGDYISEEDVLIITDFTTNYRPFIKKNPRFLFWNVLPTVFRKANDLLLFQVKSKTFKLIDYLLLNTGLVFMDKSCKEALESDFFIQVLKPYFLPIPTSVVKNTYLNRKNHNENKITITYVGRGDVIWKVFPVKKVIQDIENSSFEKDFEFIIITNETQYFYQELNKIKLKKVHIKYVINIYGSELESYLSLNSDLHFGMGTSALEGAKIGIPTILIDASKKEFPKDYKYQWLFNTSCFSLGQFIDLYPNERMYSHSMNEVLLNLVNRRNELSLESFKYVKDNHSIRVITENLIKFSSSSQSRIEKFVKYSERQKCIFQFTRKIFK